MFVISLISYLNLLHLTWTKCGATLDPGETTSHGETTEEPPIPLYSNKKTDMNAS